VELDPGSRIGPYTVRSLLGSGGMGQVYAAFDPRLNREIAVKILASGSMATPEDRERLRREARAVAALNHPNIVTVYSVEDWKGSPFLTMELVKGQPLNRHIPAGGMPTVELIRLALPIVDAIATAHAQGIIHRDLKPSNVMVEPRGSVKVLDFGLAKQRQRTDHAGTTRGVTDLTGRGAFLGTAAYMSPEQAEGRPLDQGSDIFSLGVMFYEMASGVRPFTGDSTLSVLTAILRDTPRRLGALKPVVPDALERIIHRCLAKDPTARYQAAADLRLDLEELREQLTASPIALGS
jgi:eukaryotic-like serine/threonine-protein kinase